MVFVFTVVFTTCFFFLSVLVSESTSQVEKIRKKSGVGLSEHPVKPVWASCQQSQGFKKTAVCEPIPFRPLEASRMHLLSTGERSTIQQTNHTSQPLHVSQLKPAQSPSILLVTNVPPGSVQDQTH